MRREVTAEELATPLLAPADAVARMLGSIEPLPPRARPVGDSLGLALAVDVVADRDVPSFANSAMDGYAVRSQDVASASPEDPVVLRLAGEVAAGATRRDAVEPGTAVKIMTGAPVPPGADAVVPWEDTRFAEGHVEVMVPAGSGRHVRPSGEDIRAGTTVLRSGDVLGPAHVGVLAMLGRVEAGVRPRPRVAVLSTGDELVPPGETLGEGQLHDSNGALLRALCERAGADVVETGLVPDDPERIASWLGWWAEGADLLVTSGGASVGEHDWIRDVLGRIGEVALWRVAMRPGKPVLFGRAHDTPVIGLPGNPGSVFACAHVFVAPAIRRLGGRDPSPRSLDRTLARDVAGDPKRTFYCPVTLEDERAVPVPSRSSQALSNVLDAEAFAIVPPGGVAAGAEVTVELLA